MKGVEGSSLMVGLRERFAGFGARGFGGFADNLPLGFAPGLSSRMNWFPALIAGFGVDETGGREWPCEFVALPNL